MFVDEFIVGHISNTSNENLYISISTFVPRRDIQLIKIQQYRENLQYKKTADLVLLSPVMRTNGKSNISHSPHRTSINSILLSVRTQYSRRTRI